MYKSCPDHDLSLQTISLLVYMSGALGETGPFLVLSPLSVLENWRTELERYRRLHSICYSGLNALHELFI